MSLAQIRANGISTALRSDGLSYWVIADGARRNGLVYALIEQHLQKHPGTAVSLLDGQAFLTMGREGPWLLAATDSSPLFDQWFNQGWGDSWGVFLATSEKDMTKVKLHLKKMLMAYVAIPDTNESLKALYRFYDPRVLRDTLPFLSLRASYAMFEKLVHCYAVEGVRTTLVAGRETVSEIYRYSLAPETFLQKLAGVSVLQTQTITLALGQPAGQARPQPTSHPARRP
ncbi:DUF4123 domain-containing protein [Comamonas sp. 4034]|uniref:DUF4123 domain-containing protein n=1 Tax=Comamonas sp. 4034 TaxID=3156455 RepID=UPI003D1BB6F4